MVRRKDKAMKRNTDLDFLRLINVDGAVESSRSRRRELPVLRRTYGTPQGQGDEAQHRYWTFYSAVKPAG